MPALTLADVLDLSAAAPLQARLLASRGDDLDLDAAGVQRLGGQCVQVLLAGKLAWQAEGRPFRILNASPAFKDAIAVMGAGPLLGQEE